MDEKPGIIEKIVLIEWDMFISVNRGKARASCQDDHETFIGMRKAQFSAWSLKAVASYLDDLEKARQNGRNLLEEKYVHMMKTTDPSGYNALLARVSQPNYDARALAQELSDKLLEQTQALFEEYPYVSGRGRPLRPSPGDEDISIETYQFCELLTYSETTLTALVEHISSLEKDGVSLARAILENTVAFYGYDSLEKADAAIKRRVDKPGMGNMAYE